jgi:hypothetical protein
MLVVPQFPYTFAPTLASSLIQADIISFYSPIVCFFTLTTIFIIVIVGIAPTSPLRALLRRLWSRARGRIGREVALAA